MLTAVLVELDGVLVDTRSARAAAAAAAVAAAVATALVGASRENPSAPADTCHLATDADDLSSSFEQLVDATLQAYAGDVPATFDDTARALVALQAERAYSARLSAGVTLVDGALDTVRALGAVYRLAAVTAWRRVDAERVLDLAGLGADFRFIAAANDGPGFASAAGRYARVVARVRDTNVTRPSAQSVANATAGTVAALVAGPSGFAAARAAGARPVLVTPDFPLRDLTPARLTAAAEAAALVAPPLPQPPARR